LKNKIGLGLIGCGLRGTGYFTTLRYKDFNFQVVALADVSERNLKSANAKYADNTAKMYKTGDELVKDSSVDAVIVATPNKFHRDPAIAVMNSGFPMLLEKPIATSLEDLTAIWSSSQQSQAKVVVGFTLRYTPFYQTIKNIIQKGVLGQILTINAEEMMSDRLSMIFCRSQWRHDCNLTGGLLLEKCCHDVDILNWISDSKAVKVSSFANRSFLTPGKVPKRSCDKCPEKKICRFSREKLLSSFYDNVTETKTDLNHLYSELINNECPYHIGTPYPDHQSLLISYENGVLCTFNVIQAQPANRRTIHILGSEARLYGVIDDNCFTIFHRTGPNNEKPEVIRVDCDSYGHNGGDPVLATDFIDLINGKQNPSRPGIKEGIESAIICLIGDKSAETRQSIELTEYRNQVFADTNISRSAVIAKPLAVN